jgi:tetratricopeptide (TPR) repeat protein
MNRERAQSAARNCWIAGLASMFVAACLVAPLIAADRWIEVKSANVTVVASTNAGMARTQAWQLEQIRSAIKAVWPWAKVDLERPLLVLAVGNEEDMRALLPRYWETRNSVRPASVMVSSPDHSLLAIRADLRAEGQANVNPHRTTYFSYVTLILDNSVDVDLPPWLARGLAEVLSNTIVRDANVLVGAPIEENLRYIAERGRLRPAELVRMKRNDPQLSTEEGLGRFDAQSWALVHMLMFDKSSARAKAFNQYFQLLAGGMDAEKAFQEALGAPEALEADYNIYLTKNVYTFRQLNSDVSVKKEGFSQRDVSASEAAALRSLLYTATNRPIEARAAFAEARTGDAAAETYVAEGLLLERESKLEEAKQAYERAAAAGSKSPYAHYRLATMRWTPNPSPDTLKGIDQLLAKATALNIRHADAYAMLGEVRSLLGDENSLGLAIRATQLEPREASHRLVVARIQMRQKRYDDALKTLQAAAALPMSPEQARVARELQAVVERK